MRAGIVALLAALAICALSPVAAYAWDLTDRDRQRIRTVAEKYRDMMHWSQQSVDIDAVVQAVAERAATLQGTADIGPWIREEMNRSWGSWIPRDPRPQYEAQYAFPVDLRVPRLVMSAESDGPVDFLAPVGTPVYAARSGEVARVIDGFTECCLPIELRWKTNQVVIVHEDGTAATYSRLRPGIDVKEGQHLEAGDRIGQTGFTGAAATPGLFFFVWQYAKSGPTGMPIRFVDGSPAGRVLAAGEPIAERPARRLRLRLYVDGERVLDRDAPRKVAPGDRVRLRLERLVTRGHPVDVTPHVDTHFDTETPWLVEVGTGGFVTFRRADWPGVPEGHVAKVTALYRDPDSGETGYVETRFELVE